MWCFSKGMNLMQIITMFQIGSPCDGVMALIDLKVLHIVHFDKWGRCHPRMWRVMTVIIHFDNFRNFWQPRHARYQFLNGETFIHLWVGMLEDVQPYLLTNTMIGDDKVISYHKSYVAVFSWRTCHDKFRKRGLFKMLNGSSKSLCMTFRHIFYFQ